MENKSLREKIYDIVLAARTEGIVGGKTKWFALDDTDAILNLIKEALNGLTVIEGTDIGDNLDLEVEAKYPCSDGSETWTVDVSKVIQTQRDSDIKQVKEIIDG